MTGRYDASWGCYLRGQKNKQFKAIPPAASGFILNGDVKDLALVKMKNGGRVVVAGLNNDRLKVLTIGGSHKAAMDVLTMAPGRSPEHPRR